MDVKRLAIIGAASVFSLCAITTWAACMVPASGAAIWAANVFPLSEPRAAAADQALGRKDFTTARQNINAALNLSPVDSLAWLKAAEIDLAAHHRLTNQGVEALHHAYDAVPYDVDPKSGRMAFMLSNMTDLPADLKLTVADELDVWASSPGLKHRLLQIDASVQSSAGHQAVRTALARSDVNSGLLAL